MARSNGNTVDVPNLWQCSLWCNFLGIDQDVGARLDGNEIGVVGGRGGENEPQIQVVFHSSHGPGWSSLCHTMTSTINLYRGEWLLGIQCSDRHVVGSRGWLGGGRSGRTGGDVGRRSSGCSQVS